MCTLRIFGRDLDVDALLSAMPFSAAAVHRRGEPRARADGPVNQASTVNIGISEAEFADLAGQVADAREFLRERAEHLGAASAFPGVDGLVLDFAIEEREVAVQSDVFPAALLAEMGALGIDLEVSRYSRSS